MLVSVFGVFIRDASNEKPYFVCLGDLSWNSTHQIRFGAGDLGFDGVLVIMKASAMLHQGFMRLLSECCIRVRGLAVYQL